ncbi:MAG: hypothetical protein WC301_07155 [Candidatus Omnitrophota bacterium]|jgi:Tfp pilus assembly protein PilW
MRPRLKKSLTLTELLISVCILSIIAIGFTSIEIFSRYHVINADRRIKTQNDASFVLRHMTNEITRAIGSASQSPISVTTIEEDPAVIIWIDYNENGMRDSAPTDRQIAYRYRGDPDYEFRYYSDYSGSPSSYEVISKKAYGFTRSSTDNYLEVELQFCYSPSLTGCGVHDNPIQEIKTRIYMPSVSTN